MTFKLSRLRGGEWIMGVAGLALLICLFATPWYGFTGVYSGTAASLGLKVNTTGWGGLLVCRYLIVLAGAGGVITFLVQATMAAPAVPICATVLDTALSFAVLLWLIVRVFISLPEHSMLIEAKSGAYAGVVLVAAIVGGGYLSLREDGVAEADAPREIETLRLAQRPARAR